ncbi:hypothetical protein CORC01_00213 [Colletotrichum orchidophilum]|uniref:Uncharacterized protein n=1 Tax=Colletotrichum orchidophilum TaxID=1209926 RepID=A0A1G4BSJ1_9PEZI|nr:uncharacterized protein CORC01_00213 [Colletotrichum orchidophilum]OHF04361.1 hypothetical protein CORC01_00213 [Colletotrichum orchidophilum]
MPARPATTPSYTRTTAVFAHEQGSLCGKTTLHRWHCPAYSRLHTPGLSNAYTFYPVRR